jgi:TonB family protein
MVRASFWASLLIIALAVPALSSRVQDTTSGGPDSVVTGPYGVPRLVVDEGGSWREPIRIFENEKVTTFVPDITSVGWIQWHAAEFRADGIYFTYLYVYMRDTRATSRVTLYVDTRKNTVKIVFSLFGPIATFEIPKAPPVIAQSIPIITAIIQDQSDRYHGQTVQEAMQAQREAYAHIVQCALSAERCPISEPSASSDSNKSGSNKSGVTPPIPVWTPTADFPPEGRRAGIKLGTVRVLITVDVDGQPKDIRVFKPFGHGFDESAVAAVRQYRFKPAIDQRTGKPVAFLLTVEVNFKLY